MLFHSFQFALFLPLVFVLYWFLRSKGPLYQNGLLLLGSLYFYACWDWHFLGLFCGFIGLNYCAGRLISRAVTSSGKKRRLWFSIFINLGVLGLFKYFDFFILSFQQVLHSIGIFSFSSSLSLILPLGISFYTFHCLSYLIDIYRNKIEPEKNIVNFAVFVGFFPLLLAGPIVRAIDFIPQVRKERVFNYNRAADGLRQVMWGFFMKLVIADNCAVFADPIFDHPETESGSTLLLAALFFSVQIYADFSGYSNIAIGVSRLFGFELKRNFSTPYFSRNVAEFWRKWHISLSSWFKDYVYISLGGSRGSKGKTVRNVILVFFLSALWHGANWNFLAWGLMHILFVLPYFIFSKKQRNLPEVASGKLFPSLGEFVSLFLTFGAVTFAWIFFRMPDVEEALHVTEKLFSKSIFCRPNISFSIFNCAFFFLTFFFFAIEWIGRNHNHPLEKLVLKWPSWGRVAFYYSIAICILLFRVTDAQQFIYFQF